MSKKYFQSGFAPILLLIIAVIIAGASIVIIKNLPFNQSQPTPDKSFQGNSSTKTESSPSPTITGKQTKNTTLSPTPKSSPTPTNSTNNNSNNPTNTPTPTSTPTSTPIPTPTPKTYTWNGNNVNAKTICDLNSQNLFSVQISGSVTPQQYNDGIWTTLTGNGSTVITSYDAGAGITVPIRVAVNSINGSIGSIRGGSTMTLRMTDNSNTYMYELKVYEAPYTDGTPTLTAQLGNVSFATDCR